MATQRATKTVVKDISQQQANAAFAEYCKAANRENTIKAKMEAAITRIRETHADELTSLEAIKSKQVDMLETYAKENGQLFADKKSYEMTHGVIGFRTGTPKLGLLKKFKWADVLEAAKKKLPDYVRTVEELNKAGLIAAREQPEVIKLLPVIGCEIVQDETFYVEPKKEKEATA